MKEVMSACSLLVLAALLCPAAAGADDVRVMSSGALAPPYLKLVAQFEQTTEHKLITLATSTGIGSESIPSRVRSGERVDVIILSAAAIDELIKDGLVVAGSRVDLARSGIGMAVRKGAPKPDIRTVDGLKRALRQARSVAYSAQISGVYLSTELFQRLGIADEVLPKGRRIERGMVGPVVARGEAEIGFQQISELLAVPGIDYVGPLPAEVQRISLFSAGLATNAPSPRAARALIAFLASPSAQAVFRAGGLEPVSPDRR